MLGELAITFYKDDSILKKIKKVESADNQGPEVSKLLTEIIEFSTENCLNWIVIFDQHNALYGPHSVAHLFPFDSVSVLSRKTTVIVSASANDEATVKFDDWNVIPVAFCHYEEAEFNIWCLDKRIITEDGKPAENSKEFLSSALFWTGGIPYELQMVCKNSGSTWDEKLTRYKADRCREIARLHDKFCKNLSPSAASNLQN